MEDSTRRATAKKRLHVNQRVSGAIRDYIPGPTKHQHGHRLYGHIISAIGEWKYLVRFDNGSEKECSSALLRVEKMHMNVPPDIQLPIDSNLEHRFVLEELEIEVIDQEEEEPLGASPNEEEIEEELGDVAQKDGGPPNGMPGQLPTEKEQPLANNYMAIKKQALEKFSWERKLQLRPRTMGQ
jgi:hypothetical protein